MIAQHPLKNLFTTWAKQLGLVPRQEFDIQSKVLLHTRLKLEKLEKELQKLSPKTITDKQDTCNE